MPRPFPAGADPAELERTYRLERELADRLRAASPERRKLLYTEVYGEYAREVGGAAPDRGSLELQKSLLASWLRAEMTFAEVGAGSGALARGIADRVGRVLAIEAVVPELEHPRLEWLRHDETGSRIPDASVDLAYSCHVIEHLHPDDLPDHFAEVLRWLRPGAPYLMVTPNRLCGPHDVSGYFADHPEGFHLREYSHRDLATVARDSGFERVDAVDRRGRQRSLWPVAVAERCLEMAGATFRRRLFDRFPPMARRAPLRPLEQVTLAAFAPDHGEAPTSRRSTQSSRPPSPMARRK